MGSVLQGFLTIWLVVGVGWLLAHVRILDEDAQLVLSKVSFHAGSPALLFLLVSDADLRRLFSENLLVTGLATLLAAALYLAVNRVRWHHHVGEAVIGTLCSSYVNAANMGLPIATFVLHDATWIAPVLLMQVGLLQPTALAILDARAAAEAGRPARTWRYASMPLRNPMTVGVLAGLAVNLWHVTLPALVVQPVRLVGQLAVPSLLVAFGVALRLGPRPGHGPGLDEALVSSGIKLLVQPAVAIGLSLAVGLDRTTTLAVAVIAGLPTAQNVFVNAVRYGRATTLARDVIVITSFGSIGTVALMAAVLR